MTCCIVGAGPSPAYICDGAYIIAADGGLSKLAAMGVTPDLILGDFDSLGRRPDGDNVLAFPPAKDDTDMILAMREAVRRGFDRLYLSGGVGGRLDHTVANLQALALARDLGATAFLVGDAQTALVLTEGTVTFSENATGTVSVFSFDSLAEGVSLEGLVYGGADLLLTNRFPLGVSNAFCGKTATVGIRRGTLLLIWDGGPDLVVS